MTLNDICSLIVDSEHKTAPTSEVGYPYIRTPNIGSGRLILDKMLFVDENIYREWTKRAIPQADDLIIAREAPVGNVIRINEGEKFCLGQRTVLLRPNKEKVDADYLMYYLLAPNNRNRLLGASSGATVAHLNLSDLRSLDVSDIPDISEQSKIIKLLKEIDKLFFLNSCRIKNLETSAQMIYKEWFVNFKLPNYEKIKMIDSGHPAFDEIPDSWRVTNISDTATFIRGRSYTSAQLTEDTGEDFVNLKCFTRGGGFRRSGIKKYIGPTKPDQILKPRDIVIAVTDMTQDRAIVARAARVPLNLSSNATFSMDLIKIQAKPNIDKNWIYAYLRFSGMADHVKQFANGANVLHLNPKLIMDYPILIPSNEFREKFSSQYTQMLDLIDNLETQNETLAKIRDLLLPKLISGEIDVSELSDFNIENLTAKKSDEATIERTRL